MKGAGPFLQPYLQEFRGQHIKPILGTLCVCVCVCVFVCVCLCVHGVCVCVVMCACETTCLNHVLDLFG